MYCILGRLLLCCFNLYYTEQIMRNFRSVKNRNRNVSFLKCSKESNVSVWESEFLICIYDGKQLLRTSCIICYWLFNLFSFSSCPYLSEKITPAIPAIGGILFFFVMGTLLRTSFSDPGVLPRATPDEAADLERQIGNNEGLLSLCFPPEGVCAVWR